MRSEEGFAGGAKGGNPGHNLPRKRLKEAY
jgi:hypothetical protein